MMATVNKVMAMMKQAPGMMVVKHVVETLVMVVQATVMMVVEGSDGNGGEVVVVTMMRGVVM